MGLSSLTAVVSTGFRWNAQNDLTGSVYNPIQNPGNITKQLSLGTASGNTTTGGADELFSFQQGIVAGASATVNLITMTNILSQASVTIARIKAYQIRLLSAADDSTISPAPNSSSHITVTNIGPANPVPLDFSTNGSGLTLAVTQSAGAISAVSIGAAGSGYPPSWCFLALPVQNGSSGGAVSVTTNSGGIPTAVAVAAGGANYSNATLPSVVGGQYTILTGGAHMYFDPNANGFTLVSSTQKNFIIYNDDPSNAVTFELDVVACSS